MKQMIEQNFDLPSESVIFGSSDAMKKVQRDLAMIASADIPVLIQGPSGTGKEIIAKLIHRNSPLAKGPYVKVNCPAIPDALLESELFGYEKGAFSGAVAAKPGKFELADKGTLFLDEIGDVPPAIQVKLLRVIQEREFERLGGTKTLKVDVRLIAATNRDLRAALEEGTFRQDLYYRLNVVAIDIPPLREHKEDIPALANFFVQRFAAQSNKTITGISPEAIERLMQFHWPGNVRELENVLERSITFAAGPLLTAADIRLDRPAHPANAAPVLPEGMTLDQWEQEIIREALRRANGNKSAAARALGLSRNALRYRLSQMGVADSEAIPESK